MGFRGSILLFVAFVAGAALHPSTAAVLTTSNEELLAKLNQLENVFHQQTDRFVKELAEAKSRIVNLEQQNEKLTRDLSVAKERITNLEGKVERLNGLLLLPRQSVTSNRAAAANASSNSHRMTEDGNQLLSSADDERAIVTPPPASCANLAQMGNRIAGFYLVLDEESNNRIKTVYCDFSLSITNPDYETMIGYNDIKSSPGGVSFYVQRNTIYSSTQTVIPYQVTRLNIGGAMNTQTGIFTAPVNGRYYFSFTALTWTSGIDNYVYLRLNGVNIGISYAPSNKYNLPIVATLQLKKGDTVDTFLKQGSLHDNDNQQHTQFSGFLLEEDLDLLK